MMSTEAAGQYKQLDNAPSIEAKPSDMAGRKLDIDYDASWSCYKCGRTILKYDSRTEQAKGEQPANKPPYEHRCKCGAWNYKRLG
jgi:hypothetical protein